MEDDFRLLSESTRHRVGVRSEGGREGIEILVRLHSPGERIDIRDMRRTLACLEALEGGGYLLSAQDGWWVVGEKEVPEGRLDSESTFANDLLACLLELP